MPKSVIRFGVRLVLFLIPGLALVWVLMSTVDPSNVDEHYPKLCAGEVQGLFIGSSRMSQALNPEAVGKGTKWEGALLNFAFTNATSPYGALYSESVLRRAEDIEDGLFILEINPWILSRDSREEEPREKGKTLDDLWSVSGHPNISYLLGKSKKQLWQLWTQEQGRLEISRDGWLKVAMELDSLDLPQRYQEKLEAYRDILPHYRGSSDRIQAFHELVEALKKKGEVVIVRIPVSEEMVALEKELALETTLASDLEWLASERVLDFTNDPEAAALVTHDGNHLHYSSALRFSQLVNEEIKAYSKQ